MKFTHENRFIIGIMGLWGFVDAVSPHYQYIHLFNIIMVIWVLYEEIITVLQNRNTIPTAISISIGFILYSAVRMTITTNFTDVKSDILLLLGLLFGLWVNYLSLKSHSSK